MFNKLVIALTALGLSLATPGNAQTRVQVRTPELSVSLGDNPRAREYRYHKRFNSDFDRQPYCNRHKPYLIRDAYTGRLKCVSRHKYERHHYRYGW